VARFDVNHFLSPTRVDIAPQLLCLIIFLQKVSAERSKVLAEFDDAMSRAGLPHALDGPLMLENAQTGERLTIRVENKFCQCITSKVSKN
jgi:hypothetical protein